MSEKPYHQPRRKINYLGVGVGVGMIIDHVFLG
jgi:hypothetical protein